MAMRRRIAPATILLLCYLLLQCFIGRTAAAKDEEDDKNVPSSATTTTIAGNGGVHISGETRVDGMSATGAIIVRFLDTDFQGLTMEVETDRDPLLQLEQQAMTLYHPNGTVSDTIYIPFQKISGAIDCINQQLEDDAVIVSGTIQGTANEPMVDYRPFKEGDRFMTAIRGNHHGDGEKDQIGEISNLGPQDNPDLSDCMYFMTSDFELREVVGGHITVY